MENKFSLIMIIINSGYSEKAMECAKREGARGGTIFNAVGSVGLDAEKLYGININPDKEVILILVPSDLVNKVLKSLYDDVGANTPSQGIAFSIPVDEASSNLMNQYKKKPLYKDEKE